MTQGTSLVQSLYILWNHIKISNYNYVYEKMYTLLLGSCNFLLIALPCLFINKKIDSYMYIATHLSFIPEYTKDVTCMKSGFKLKSGCLVEVCYCTTAYLQNYRFGCLVSANAKWFKAFMAWRRSRSVHLEGVVGIVVTIYHTIWYIRCSKE